VKITREGGVPQVDHWTIEGWRKWRQQWDWCEGFIPSTQTPLSLLFSLSCRNTPLIFLLKSINLFRSEFAPFLFVISLQFCC